MPHHPILRLALVLLLAAGATATETPRELPAMPAASAARFVDSCGINVVVYDDPRHHEIVVPRLAELGIRHLRVGLRRPGDDDYRGRGAEILARTKALGDAGYRITGIFHCWYTMDQFAAVCRELLPDALHQAEGPNEPWHQDQNFRWQGEGWPEGPRRYMADLQAMLRGLEHGERLPIISFSGSTGGYGSIEQLVDYGNEHIYPDGGRGITQDDALAAKIRRCRETNYPTVLLQFTESGYNSGEGDDPGIRPTSPWMQARGVPRLYLEAFRHGLHRLFVYGLHMRHDQGFSLLHPDGSPKPAFGAVRDLLAILGGADQEAIEPGSLPLAIDCATPSVHHLLLRRGDGAFVLCLWNDVDGWDEVQQRDIGPDPVPATLRLAATPRELASFTPAVSGTRATALGPARELQLAVPDHPLLVVIWP